MLFDLNIKNNLAQNFDKQDSTTNTELSTTSSTSSIVNADESPVSGTGVYDFFVDDPFVTRQLFPTTIIDDDIGSSGDGGGQRELEVLRLGGSSQSSKYNQWLNLSVSGSSLGVVGDNNNNQQVRRSRRGPRSRSSQYRGVTFYRRTGRWESHIWDCGKQVYLGGFDTAHAAARAYDRAAIKFRGIDADINFNLTDYDEDMKQTKNLNKVDFVQVLRRQSNGFSRGNSRYRGVTLNKCGRWEARMGQFFGNKAYNQAPIQCKGREVVTNFVPGTDEGDGHNLDLNLGIPITMGGPKASNNMGKGESQIHEFPIQLPYGKRPVNGPSTYYSTGALPLYGQPMASRQSSTMCSEFPQGQLGTYEERVNDQKVILSARQSNWAWHMQSQGKGGGEGGTSSQVQLSTNAASSGFPFLKPSPSSFTSFPHPQINHNINSFHQGGQGRS